MNLSCAVQSSIQTKGAEDTYFGDTNGNKTARCAFRRLTWARLEDFFRRRNFFPNFESNFPKENIGTEPGPLAAGWLSAHLQPSSSDTRILSQDQHRVRRVEVSSSSHLHDLDHTILSSPSSVCSCTLIASTFVSWSPFPHRPLRNT